MDKRKLKLLLLIFSIAFVFSIAYLITINIYDNSNGSSKRQVLNLNNYVNSKAQYDADSTTENENAVVSSDAKIIYNTKYKKSGDIILESVATAVDFAGKTKAQIEKQLGNGEYKLGSFKSSKLIFIREFDRYAPNKYVLGIEGDYIAIFKTDSEGNMYIEDKTNDITNRKIDKLKEQDIKMLTNGDKYFECDTRDEVAAILEDYE